MLRKSLTVLLILIGFYAAALGQSNVNKKFTGKWTGTYEGNGQMYKASITLKEDNGKLSGFAESTESPDPSPMPMENIVISGNAISFEVMSAIKYAGSFVEAKNSIEGTLTGMSGDQTKLAFVKEEVKAPALNAEFFAGTWKATITGGDGEKVIVIVLGNKDGKLEGTIEIPEQNVGPFPLENLKLEGNKLTFEIMSGAVTFEGKYNADKKMIEGVGIENGNPASINFVKDEKAPAKK